MRKLTVVAILLIVLMTCVAAFAQQSEQQVSRKYRNAAEEEFKNFQESGTVRDVLEHYISWYETKLNKLRQIGASNDLINKVERYLKNCQIDLNNYKENNPQMLSIRPLKGQRTIEFINAMPEVEVAIWKSENKSQPVSQPKPEPKQIRTPAPAPVEREEPINLQVKENSTPETTVNETAHPVPDMRVPETVESTQADPQNPNTEQRAEKTQTQPESRDSSLLSIAALSDRVSTSKEELLYGALIVAHIFFVAVMIYFFIRKEILLRYAYKLEKENRKLHKNTKYYEAFIRKINSNILQLNRIPTDEDLDPDVVYARLTKLTEDHEPKGTPKKQYDFFTKKSFV